MINAGIVGLGWWGRTLVEAVSGGQSGEINFVAGAARTHTEDLKAFAKQQKFELYDSYERLLKHPKLNATIDTEQGEVTYFDEQNVAVAVDTERGLMTPVVTGARDLSIAGLALNVCGT